MIHLSLQLRLSLAFAAAMAVLLTVAGTFQYGHLANALSQALDLQLRQSAQNLIPVVTRARGGGSPLAGHSLVEKGESFAEVVDPGGAVLEASDSLHRAVLLAPAELARARHGAIFLNRPQVPGLDEPARLLAVPVVRAGQPAVLVIGATAQNRAEALASLRAELFVGAPLTLLLTSIAGYLLAGAALRPVESMRRRAANITAQDPGQRLPVPPRRDELSRLGQTLNDMLARVEESVDRERSFLADASHELRTPLAALRTELELALRRPRSAEDLRMAVESAAEETERLSRLADDLLLIARADQGKLPVRMAAIDLGELMARVMRGISWPLGRQVAVDYGGVRQMTGDALRIEQALRNLLDNALRHGAGDVSLTAVAVTGGVELHVRDHGPGMPVEFVPRAFERFSRADDSRGPHGAGLGLSIVQAVAVAHGGTATAANMTSGGADVWLTIPDQDPIASESTRPGSGSARRGSARDEPRPRGSYARDSNR
ncbi:MAG: ATP-binding protein [Actinomycetota bacterium]|nr:ATP-binding protein [Actinomycetota bacterium]